MSRYIYFVGIIVAGFLALGMFQAKSGASQSQKEIRRLETANAELQSEIEYDHLAGSDRIARLAAEELGMGPARSFQMLDVETAAETFGPLIDYEETK